jgi:hypothetical protein
VSAECWQNGDKFENETGDILGSWHNLVRAMFLQKNACINGQPRSKVKQRHLKCRSYDKKEDMIST